VICAPQLGRDENVFSLNSSRGESSIKALANFIFVAVAVGCVDMFVTDLYGMFYRPLYVAGLALPSTYEV